MQKKNKYSKPQGVVPRLYNLEWVTGSECVVKCVNYISKQ